MSKLASLIGKSKVFTIGGIELEIKPLTLKNLDLIMDLSDEQKKGHSLQELIRVTLRESIPDSTDEEIAQIGLGHFKALTEIIIEVNGLSTKDASTN